MSCRTATSPTSDSTYKRIDLLDGWRSLAVLLMLLWHAMWDLSGWGVLPAALPWTAGMQAVREFIVCSFVFLAGISSRFSHSNLRRGVRTLLGAALVSAVSVLAGDPILFGVLHLLGCCMLFWHAAEKGLLRVKDTWGCPAAFVLFALLRALLWSVRVKTPWLWPLGFRTASFYSADYYPLLPWIFLFLSGGWAGGIIRRSAGAWKQRRLPAALTLLGRNAMLIYLAHQPIYYGLYYLCRYLLKS